MLNARKQRARRDEAAEVYDADKLKLAGVFERVLREAKLASGSYVNMPETGSNDQGRRQARIQYFASNSCETSSRKNSFRTPPSSIPPSPSNWGTENGNDKVNDNVNHWTCDRCRSWQRQTLISAAF